LLGCFCLQDVHLRRLSCHYPLQLLL